MPAYAGYSRAGKEIYVGECCKAEIGELASHMYWWWDSYKRPKPEDVLWRFMDFSKFVSLLKEGALYFARSDLLGDRFEGARGVVKRKSEWREYTLGYYRDAIRTAPVEMEPISEEEIQKRAEVLHEQVETAMANEIRHTYVSCWHRNDVESEALWRLYCSPGAAGVCLRTTFKDLDEAITEGEHHLKFGNVRYIDFRTQFAGTYDRIFWKRKSLSHEQEVRGVILERGTEPEKAGLFMPIDLQRCVHSVIPSPFGPSWFPDVLSETLCRFGYSLPIRESELADEPFV